MIFCTRSQEYASVSEMGTRPDLEDDERAACGRFQEVWAE